jgi:hypothetical protein
MRVNRSMKICGFPAGFSGRPREMLASLGVRSTRPGRCQDKKAKGQMFEIGVLLGIDQKVEEDREAEFCLKICV